MPTRRTTGTTPSTPRLSDVAKRLCVPAGIVTTGWGAVERKCARLGIHFDTWQTGLGSLILAKRDDGQYAAGVGGAVMSIPRQTGKTYLVGWMVFALCLLHPGLTVIWTAHRVRTSQETLGKMAAMADRQTVAPSIATVRTANGKEAIIFRNGARILFGARESGFGRGFDKVDLLVLDEAQILTEAALSDMVPATNAAPNGLVVMMGTPPRPKDPGEAFLARRREALSGDKDTLYVEFGADDDTRPETWPAGHIDWGQVARANPSYPHRTSKQAIQRMAKLVGSMQNFRREALGLFDAKGTRRLISQHEWDSTGVTAAPDGLDDGLKCFGVAFNLDGSRLSLAGAIKYTAGTHVELIGSWSGPSDGGMTALADWLADRWKQVGMIALSGRSGSTALEGLLRDRGVPATVIRGATTSEYYKACALFYSAIQERTVTHPVGQPGDALNMSVEVCDARRRASDGAWGWHATTDDGDDTPLEAVSLAHWATRTTRRRPGRRTGGMS